MKKIVCKNCGEIPEYCVLEKGHQYLFFNAEDEPTDAGEFYTDYCSSVKRCPKCGKKIEIRSGE